MSGSPALIPAIQNSPELTYWHSRNICQKLSHGAEGGRGQKLTLIRIVLP